jgi:NADP-dependent 3-hydroxy acid dehydrogenase YdfG
MRQTVLITGSSSGIGRAAAILFHNKGWNVIATMRSPEKEAELKKLSNLVVEKLSVEDTESIKNAIQKGLEKFGKIDVIVNNAGYSLTGPFEDARIDQIKKQFDTNVFGLMNVTREILPHFRANRKGTIINVSSIGGKMTFPYYSLYHSTKWAVEGFSESLQFELSQFGIRVKLIEPGPIKTDFFTRSTDFSTTRNDSPYTKSFQQTMEKMQFFVDNGGNAESVALTIYDAAISSSNKLRYPAEKLASAVLFFRKMIPSRIFNKIVNKVLLK